MEFLAHHNHNDLRLYTCVQKTFSSAEGRRPFRPAFPIVTAESYEEQAYLETNPDVLEALKCSPNWSSAYDHFVVCGLPEQRRQLVPPADRRPSSKAVDGTDSGFVIGLKGAPVGKVTNAAK